MRVEDKRQGQPKLHDLPSLQKLCGSQFGWPAIPDWQPADEKGDDAQLLPPRCATARLPNCTIRKPRTRRPGHRRVTTKAL